MPVDSVTGTPHWRCADKQEMWGASTCFCAFAVLYIGCILVSLQQFDRILFCFTCSYCTEWSRRCEACTWILQSVWRSNCCFSRETAAVTGHTVFLCLVIVMPRFDIWQNQTAIFWDYDDTPYLHFATSQMWHWSGGRAILTELSLWYSIVYVVMVHSGTSSSYTSFDWIRLWSCSF